jgi:hypothetical protein
VLSFTGGTFRSVVLCCCVFSASALCGMWVTFTAVECSRAGGPTVSCVCSVSVDSCGFSSALPSALPDVLEFSSLDRGRGTSFVTDPRVMEDYEGQLWRLRDRVGRSTVVSSFALCLSTLGLVCSVWSLWISVRWCRSRGLVRGS